jgi:hypothetical protein
LFGFCLDGLARRLVPAVVFLLLSLPAFAGQVVLDNGDIISGELQGIEEEFVIWQADNFGQIRIPKVRVERVSSSTPLKIRGQNNPCLWLEMRQRKVRFRCGPGKKKVYALMGLKHVIPFANHSEANYAYGGNLRLTGWKQTGNTRVEYQELMTEVRLRHGDLRHDITISHNSQNTTNYDYANGLVFRTRVKRSIGTYSLNWFFLPRWYWANKISAEQDDSRNIQEEYRASSGLGHMFWETPKSSLDFEAALQYNRTYIDQNPPPVQPDTYPGLRLAMNFRHTFRSGLNFYHKNQYNGSFASPEPGDSKRWELRSDTGLNFPLGFGISANFSVEWAYINHARDQNVNASLRDTTYRLGANYAW